MYRGLHGNLRLWTVLGLVSRLWHVITKSIQVEAGIFSVWVYLSILSSSLGKLSIIVLKLSITRQKKKHIRMLNDG